VSIKFMLAAVAAIGFATVAHAQDVIIEGDAPLVEQAPADETVILQERVPAPAFMGGRCAQQTAELSVIGMVSAVPMRAANRLSLSKFTRNPGIQPGFLLTALGDNLSRVPSRVSAFIGVTPARQVCTLHCAFISPRPTSISMGIQPQQRLSVRERTAPRIILHNRTSAEGTSRKPIRSAPGRALKN
jgi:hypothetical protein